MIKPQEIITTENFSFWANRKFLLFIVISIFISLLIVAISFKLYQSNGSAQLDLSRPGYISVRSQAINNSNEFQNFPDSGPISQKDIDEFKSLYNDQAQNIKIVEAFKSDPFSLEALGIIETTTPVQ